MQWAEDQDIAAKDIKNEDVQEIINLLEKGSRRKQGWKVLVSTLGPTNKHQTAKQQPNSSSITSRKHLKEEWRRGNNSCLKKSPHKWLKTYIKSECANGLHHNIKRESRQFKIEPKAEFDELNQWNRIYEEISSTHMLFYWSDVLRVCKVKF